MMLYDVAIVGGGPAGLSAALTARQRNKTVLLFEAHGFSPKLSRAHEIENYLGMPAVSGKEMMAAFVGHVKSHQPLIVTEKVTNIFPGETEHTIITANAAHKARTVILATGSPTGKQLPGESRFLGRGVSYCATCDGMFFKDKKIAIIAGLPESEEETDFLAGICRQIVYIPLYKGKYPEHGNLQLLAAKPQAILGEDSVTGVQTDVGVHEVDGVFIFRDSEPFEALLPGLELSDKSIRVDSELRTNLPGVFAAGDCTGRPWQISRATGQGLVAALSAVVFLAGKKD